MNSTSIPLDLALQAAGWIFAGGVLVGSLGFKLGHHRLMRRFANDDAFAIERRKYWQAYFSGKSPELNPSRDRDEGEQH
jgi:hypothetical protein